MKTGIGKGRKPMIRAGKCLVALLAAVPLLAVSAEREFKPFTYDFVAEAALSAQLDVDNPDPAQLREIFEKRRARVLEAMPEGAMLVFSVERAQERRLEFQVPDSDNHDFIYLTGLDGIHSLDSALLLLPAAPEAEGRLDGPVRPWVVLYTPMDPEAIARRTGIEDVRLHDLRHTHASHAVMNGVPVPVVSRMLGHSNVRMTLRYAHLGDREIEADAERIGEAIAELMGLSTQR